MKQLALLLLAVLVVNGHAQDAPKQGATAFTAQQTTKARLDALDVLIKRRQYPQAFELADRLVEQFEGDVKFDFNYGLAAVETGHYDEALFAFERLVFGAPKEPRYRLELARTHFHLRNLIRAEVEFEKVLAQKPPEAVRKNVEKFLDRIVELRRMVQPKFLFALDLSGGYDSNINSATDEEALSLVVDGITFNNVRLDDEARETASSYWSTLLNFGYLSPLSKTTSYDLRLIYNKRANTEIELYDLDTAMFEAGYGFFTGPIRWRGAGRYQFVQLNGEDFLTTTAFLAQGTWRLKSGFSYGLHFNSGASQYEADPSGDLSQTQVRLSFTSAPKKRSWNFSLMFGSDSADESSNDHNGKSYQGFNYRKTTLWGQRGSRYWLIDVLASEYDAANPTFPNVIRKDTLFTWGLGWRYAFTTSFSIRNDYSLTYQDSELEANTYKRGKAEFGLTYSF